MAHRCRLVLPSSSLNFPRLSHCPTYVCEASPQDFAGQQIKHDSRISLVVGKRFHYTSLCDGEVTPKTGFRFDFQSRRADTAFHPFTIGKMRSSYSIQWAAAVEDCSDLSLMEEARW
jgi:hypothetical protein